ncbi:MAG: ISKra4 family transposase [Acidobacteriota bacterium]
MPAGQGFFPLDKELELEPEGLSPSLVEGIALLGSWMPFAEAAKIIGQFWKVSVSEATVRRTTEKSGEAYVEIQTAQVEALEKELPEAPQGPALQQISVDGAMVPLLHKEWAEVKTLAIGTIGEAVLERGERAVHARDMSYFSRLAEHQSFSRLATVETHRRGTESAGKVCAVMDGAEWLQKFIDLHRPDAVRILDWCHGAEYLAKAGQAVLGAGTAAASEWLGVQLHQLKHGDPGQVLSNLRELSKELEATGRADTDASKTLKSSLEYLQKRQEQIRYAEFQAMGYPIGSGAVESANKLVMEARLKGSGMHWAQEHVNPMLALRTMICSDRWEEAWPQITRRRRERTRRCAAASTDEPSFEQNLLAKNARIQGDRKPSLTRSKETIPTNAEPGLNQTRKTPNHGPRRPAANHPWRRMPVGRAGSPNPAPLPGAKI